MLLPDIQAIALKKYLILQLEPICDADPDVLSDYVIALLKHDKPIPELMKLCHEQLQDFLRQSTDVFLDSLFKTLSLEYSAQPPPILPIIPSPDINPIPQYHKRKLNTCQDYASKGYCLKGDSCQYEHIVDKLPPNRPPYDRPSYNRPPYDRPPYDRPSYDRPSYDRPPYDRPPYPQNPQNPQLSQPYDPEAPALDRPQRDSRYSHDSQKSKRNTLPPKLRKDTLVIEKIPKELCTLDNVNEYFKRFGSIINIQVYAHQQKAYIQYEKYSDAQSAYQCPDVIFGNRFVKVYWSREQQKTSEDENSTQSLPQSPTPTAPIHSPVVPFQSTYVSDSYKTPKQLLVEKNKHLLQIQMEQEAVIAKQIEEQKLIMNKLTTSTNLTPQDKKMLLEQLKMLSLTTQSLVETAAEQTLLVKKNAEKTAESEEKIRLDRELDLLHPSSSEPVDPALKAELESLQAEAKALGLPIPSTDIISTTYNSRGRGRGRGRGGRGGNVSVPRTFNLDLRTRKILVTGTTDSFKESLNEHCVSLEGVESIAPQTDKTAIITFTSRKLAEIAILKPIKISGLEGIQVNWFEEEKEETNPVLEQDSWE